MTYYLGRVGTLVALPDPEVGLSTSYERIGGTHQLLSGSRVRDTVGRLRTWQLSWTAIDLVTYGTLEGFYFATGPFVLMDPEQRNLLPPNVASGGDTTVSATGVTAGPNITVAASNDVHSDGVTSFILSEPTSVTAFQDALSITTPVPIVPSLPYTLSAMIDPATGAPGHFVWGEWLDGNFAVLSGIQGNTVAAGGAGTSTVTGTAPSNAAYLRMKIRPATNNTSGVTKFVYTDSWQLQQASSASTWVVGAGPAYVAVDSLSRTTPIAGVCDAQMTLVQVG